jgi:hypothetical protein
MLVHGKRKRGHSSALLTLSNLSGYQYEPLESPDHVRVLALQPALKFKHNLEASIFQCDRKTLHKTQTPIYEAVSYTWGEPHFLHSVVIHGLRIAITANVDVMLRHLRKVRKVRYLWIDAICLNQDDPVEKASQIERMGLIYRAAKRVNIWLGDSDDDTATVFDLFSRVFYSAVGPGDAQLESGPSIRMSINNFLSRPWFARRWVLQEAVLNPCTLVHCGTFLIPWSHLCEAIYILDHLCQPRGSTWEGIDFHPDTIPLDLHSCDIVRMLCRLRSPDRDIISLLWSFYASECKDPGDRIGALYGLAGLSPLALAKIGFKPEENWQAMYRRFARYSIRQGKGRQLLSHLFAFGSLRSWGYNQPTWVPDWSATKTTRSYFYHMAAQQQLYDPVAKDVVKLSSGLYEYSKEQELAGVGLRGKQLTIRKIAEIPRDPVIHHTQVRRLLLEALGAFSLAEVLVPEATHFLKVLFRGSVPRMQKTKRKGWYRHFFACLLRSSR